MLILSDPHEPVATGSHKHLCHVCHTAWQHGDDMLNNVPEHTCPTCGAQQWEKFHTFDTTKRIMSAHDTECIVVFYRTIPRPPAHVMHLIAMDYLGEHDDL